MSKRWLKLLGKVLVALLVLLIAFLLFERIRGQIALASFKRELAARGEKLTPEELNVSVPEADNGAPAFHEAVEQLKEGLVLPKSHPPSMSVLPSGRAIIGYREPEWVEEEITNRWEQVELDLRANVTGLARIREALEMPVFRNDLDYSQGAALLIPHLGSSRALCVWFGAESQLAIRQGGSRDARASLVAQAQLPRVMTDNRLLISELVRIAVAMIAKFAVWEALQSDVLADNDLLAIQSAWGSHRYAENMVRSLEGDRIYSDVSFELFRSSNQKTAYAIFGLEQFFPIEDLDRPRWERAIRTLPYGEVLVDFLREQVFCRIWRFAWSHQAQLIGIKQLQGLTEITRIGVTNKSFTTLESQVEQLTANANFGSLYSRLRYPFHNPFISFSDSFKKAMQAETERSLVLCAIALKRHFLRHGEHPETLDALVPEFLSAVPIDYMDGQLMKYRRNTDGSFTLYSVGEDGVDDGGDASLQPDRESFRNLWHRKDVVWPQPALPEEVEVWRKEAERD